MLTSSRSGFVLSRAGMFVQEVAWTSRARSGFRQTVKSRRAAKNKRRRYCTITITVEIRESATNAVERPLEEISAVRSHPFVLTISSANLLSLCRSRNLREPLVSLFLSCIRACEWSRAGASPLESQFGRCPDGGR